MRISKLLLHSKRSNYISRIWRQTSVAEMDIQDPKEHGWNEDFTLKWHDEAYPQDVTELLSKNEESGEDDIDSDDESLLCLV